MALCLILGQIGMTMVHLHGEIYFYVYSSVKNKLVCRGCENVTGLMSKEACGPFHIHV